MEQKLEAILFYKNEPVEVSRLAHLLQQSESEVIEGLKRLQTSLKERGICLILTDTEASLATAPQMTELIEQIAKEEMSREIGKAGLETLAIILYNSQGISRRKIDFIRGVNSSFIIRNLLTRGLIERSESRDDQRGFIYKPTSLLLAHLGIKALAELPEFEVLEQELHEAVDRMESEEKETN